MLCQFYLQSVERDQIPGNRPTNRLKPGGTEKKKEAANDGTRTNPRRISYKSININEGNHNLPSTF